jgi:hypothetical protein
MNLVSRRLGAFVAILTFLFWQMVNLMTDKSPLYGGELFAAKSVGWQSFWTWTDYDGYDRFSPFGALLIAVFDIRIIRPVVEPDAVIENLKSAEFLIHPMIMLFALISYLVFRFLKYLGASELSAFTGALFVGVHKGFDYYLGYVALVSMALLMIATVLNFYSFLRYLDTLKRRYLISYIVTMLWSIGLWEQWIALPLVLVTFSLAAYISIRVRGSWDKSILARWGTVFPAGMLSGYLILRSRRMTETSQVSEAEWITNYPSIWLMIEEVLVNATHRLGSTFESLFFPHPMLSAAIMGNHVPDQINEYNSSYTVTSSYHYFTIADWYVGWISGIVLTGLVLWARYVYKNGSQQELRASVVGFAFLFFGFIQHLPIKYRSYFTMPGYVSLLDYKQALSYLGAAILISTMITSWMNRSKNNSRKITIMVCLLATWLTLNNFSKVMISAWVA